VKTELLRIERLAKSFVGVEALYNVNLNIYTGEILGLLGLNGSGKSAVVEVLAGIHPKDRGRILWNEGEVNLHNPTEARRLGIHCILQTSKLVPNLSLAENLVVLSRGAGRRIMVNWRDIGEQAQHILARVGLTLPPEQRARTLTMLERHLVEIAKALHEGVQLIVMDDVTDDYTPRDFEMLKSVLFMLREQQISVLLASRRLTGMMEICDRITVLRDGATVRTLHRDEYSEQALTNLLVGYRFSDSLVQATHELGDEVLRIANAAVEGVFSHLDCTLHRGEVLGVIDLDGTMGAALAHLLCGQAALTFGAIYLRGKPFRPRTLRSALAQGIGIIPEDGLGTLHRNLTLADNLSFLTYRKLARFPGRVNRRMQRFLVREYLPHMATPDQPDQTPVDTLEKSDQLRVLLYRWLIRKPDVLVLVRPALGIDLISRKTLYALIDQLARAGIAILLISSELAETATHCDRVLLVRAGKVSETYTRAELAHGVIVQSAKS
jgi:ribose transport system ATP-binding protein